MTVQELIEELEKYRARRASDTAMALDHDAEVEVILNGDTYRIDSVRLCTEGYPYVAELVCKE